MSAETDATQFGGYGYLEEAGPGVIYGISPRKVESFAAKEIIPMGYPVFGYEGDVDECWLLKLDGDKVVFDADLVTDNSIAISVNGDTGTVAFDTDHDTTMDAIVTAIEALDPNYIADLDSTDANNRTIHVTTKGEVATVTMTVTGGASQATATITSQLSDYLVFLGVAIKVDKEPVENSVTGRSDNYAIGDTVSVMSDGYIWGVTDGGTIVVNTEPKVEGTGANIGLFTPNASATGVAVGGYYKEVPVSGDLAVVRVLAQTKI